MQGSEPPGPPPQLYQPEFQRELVKKLQQQGSIDQKPLAASTAVSGSSMLVSAQTNQQQMVDSAVSQLPINTGGQGTPLQQPGSQIHTPPAAVMAAAQGIPSSALINSSQVDPSTAIPIYQPSLDHQIAAAAAAAAAAQQQQQAVDLAHQQMYSQQAQMQQQEYVSYQTADGSIQNVLSVASLPASSSIVNVQQTGSVVSSPGQYPPTIQEEIMSSGQVDSRPGSVLEHHQLATAVLTDQHIHMAADTMQQQQQHGVIMPGTASDQQHTMATVGNQVSCVTCHGVVSGDVVQVTCCGIPPSSRVNSYPTPLKHLPKLDIAVASQFGLSNLNSFANGSAVASSGANTSTQGSAAPPTGQPYLVGVSIGDNTGHLVSNCSTASYPATAPIIIHQTAHSTHNTPLSHPASIASSKDYRRGSLPVVSHTPHFHHHPNIYLYPTGAANPKMPPFTTSLESLTGHSRRSETRDSVSAAPQLPASLTSKYPGAARLLKAAFPNQNTRRRSADPGEIYRARQGMRLLGGSGGAAVTGRSGSASPNRGGGNRGNNTAALLYQQDFGGGNSNSSEELFSYLETRRSSAGNAAMLSPVIEDLALFKQLHMSKSMTTIREMGSQSSLQVLLSCLYACLYLHCQIHICCLCLSASCLSIYLVRCFCLQMILIDHLLTFFQTSILLVLSFYSLKCPFNYLLMIFV